MVLRQVPTEDAISDWLLPIGVWSFGAGAGWITIWFWKTPEVHAWIAVLAAVCVSLISLALQMPAMTRTIDQDSNLNHVLWLLGSFAQTSWAGFLATRVEESLASFVVIIVCLGSQLWITALLVGANRLAWLTPKYAGLQLHEQDDDCGHPAEQAPNTIALALHQPDELSTNNDRIIRQYVDALDENNVRYLSGRVVVPLQAKQRQASIVLSFVPAMEGKAQVDLECEHDGIELHVENATECGARVLLRRTGELNATSVDFDWYATAGDSASNPRQALP